MVRTFALVLGVVYLLGGIAGFIPALVQPPTSGHDLVIEAGHGRVFGLFPVNVLHNIVHIGVGLWGIFSRGSVGAAVSFSRGLTIFYGLLALLGLVPAAETMFGLVPLHGNDVWLHAGTALLAAYFGWGPPARETARTTTTTTSAAAP